MPSPNRNMNHYNALAGIRAVAFSRYTKDKRAPRKFCAPRPPHTGPRRAAMHARTNYCEQCEGTGFQNPFITPSIITNKNKILERE